MGLLKHVTDGKPPRMPSSAGKGSVLTVPKPLEADPSTVSPEAKQKLAELYSLGIVDSTLMDQHCLGLLAAIPAFLQTYAVSCLAEGISVAENKRAYITQLLKSIRASAGSSAAAALKSDLTPVAIPGNTATSVKLVSNTGKVINPNDISIRLNPSSIFYDTDLAMCWRVLTRQDKAGGSRQLQASTQGLPAFPNQGRSWLGSCTQDVPTFMLQQLQFGSTQTPASRRICCMMPTALVSPSLCCLTTRD